MKGFSDNLDALDTAVADNLCDPADFYPDAGGDPVLAVPVILIMPGEDVLVGKGTVVVDRPTMQILVSAYPTAAKDDVALVLGAYWKLAEAPKRVNDGRWFEVALSKTSGPPA